MTHPRHDFVVLAWQSNRRPPRVREFVQLISDLSHFRLQVASIKCDPDPASRTREVHMRIGLNMEGPYADLMSALRARDLDCVIEHLDALPHESLHRI